VQEEIAQTKIENLTVETTVEDEQELERIQENLELSDDDDDGDGDDI
jgi:hypothetical protein